MRAPFPCDVRPLRRLRRIRRAGWTAAQRLRPASRRLPAATSVGPIGIVGVFRTRHADNIAACLCAAPVDAAVRLWCLDGQAPNELADCTLGHGPGSRFELLNRLIATIPMVDRRGGLILLDDDVRFLVGDVGRLAAAAVAEGFDLYQPAHAKTSHANWRFVVARLGTYARRTDFVEQGPVVGLSAAAQRALLPLPEDMGMGWGVEARWWQASNAHGLVQGIVDAALIEHLEEAARGYDRSTAEDGLAREVGLVGLRSITDLHVVRDVRRRPSSMVQPQPALDTDLVADAGGPQLSVVIPTRHRRDGVLRVVHAVLRDPAVGEVVVVVDGGTDDTLPVLEALAVREPRVRPFWQGHAGAGAARQLGAESSSNEVLLFLDDDVVPRPGLALRHISEHDRLPGRVVVGAMPLHVRARRGRHAIVDELYQQDYEICIGDYMRNGRAVLAHLWAGNVSMPRELALRVGIGDPQFDQLFFEDRDLGLRLRAAGAVATFLPDLGADHHHVGTLATYLRDSVRQGRGLAILRDRYPDDVPEPTAHELTGRFPVPARWMVSLALRSPFVIAGAIERALLVAGHLTGGLRARRLQRPIVVLLRRVGQAHGVALERRARRPNPEKH